jgi:hypothetical protein
MLLIYEMELNLSKTAKKTNTILKYLEEEGDESLRLYSLLSLKNLK